ncbi:MAG TPA: ribosome silencing factor [Blastocatellia bacterium]|nr:ribosome silencing factor [Blastocatellia bacterium]
MSKVLNEEIAQNEQLTGTAVLAPEDQQIFEQVKLAAAAAEEKKTQDLLLLRLSAITEFTDYFMICSGSSTRQTQAIADAIVEQLKLSGVRPLNTEGYNSGEWILIDYGAFIVHIFTEESRRFYDLERLWRDAEKVEL